MSKKLQYTVTVDHPEEGPKTFGPDDEVPAWAAKLITNPSAWAESDGDDADDEADNTQSYGDLDVAQLQALADERELEVAGTGANGNVVKKDLIAALQADDQA